jgi:hypothetical protein
LTLSSGRLMLPVSARWTCLLIRAGSLYLVQHWLEGSLVTLSGVPRNMFAPLLAGLINGQPSERGGVGGVAWARP